MVKATSVECEVQIGSQSGLSTVEYEDEPESEPAEVLMSLPLTGLKYNKTKDAGILCPLNGTGTKTDGKYSGKALLAAASGGESTAFQDGTISITVPSEVKFDAVKEEKSFSIRNGGSTQWKITDVALELGGTGGFTPKKACVGQVLKKVTPAPKKWYAMRQGCAP